MAVPHNVAPLWESLKNEVLGIYLYWINYRQLFGKGKERVDLLNEVAGECFYVIQDVLMNDIQMSLSKLADAAVSVGMPNASLQRLVDELTAANPQLSADLSARLDSYKHRCREIKIRRNKQLSHSDLTTLLIRHGQAVGTPIPGPSRQEIEQALEALRGLMNYVTVAFNEDSLAYDLLVTHHDSESLVFTLKQGMRYEQLERDGKIHYDDLKKNFDRYDA